ncbi:MAG: hypothetical protein R3A46_16580 [Thermomicrobiales bacterium]
MVKQDERQRSIRRNWDERSARAELPSRRASLGTLPSRAGCVHIRPPISGTTGSSWTHEHWPERVERRYAIVPTICFNCEAACGLLAYVDKETLRIRKLEGNPLHPGSRGLVRQRARRRSTELLRSRPHPLSDEARRRA